MLGLGSLCLALAVGGVSVAAFSDPAPRGWTAYGPIHHGEAFGRPTSLDWSSDQGFLIAAIALGIAALLSYAAAFRTR